MRVTVVGGNRKTVESLRQYLNAAGVDAQVMYRLPERAAGLPLGDAIVIFPDNFDTDELLSTVEALQEKQPCLRLLLVTSSPQTYKVKRVMDWARPPLLFPKPVFGWSILDAIRASSSTGRDLSWAATICT